MEKTQNQSILKNLFQISSNNWAAFIILFFLLLAAYLPVLNAYYLHTDDYFWSYWGGFRKHSVLMVMTSLGRPLEGLLFCALQSLKHLKAMNIVRFLSVLNLSCLALLISIWLRMNKVNALLSLLTAVLIITLPPFQVYASYISTAADGFSATLAILALLCVHQSLTNTCTRPAALRTLAVFLLIASLALYQLAAFYYWTMLSALVLTADPKHFVRDYWKKITLYFCVFVVAVLVYYAAWRFHLWYFQPPSSGRYDARLFVQDPYQRIHWFFDAPLFAASNLWNIHPTAPIAYCVGALTLLGAFSDFFKKDFFSEKTSVFVFYNLIVKILFLLSFFPATYIIALASFDPSPQYRTYLCISSLFVLFISLGLYNLFQSFFSRKSMAGTYFILMGAVTAYAIYMANSVVINYFVIPDSFEVRFVQSEVLGYLKTHADLPQSVNVIVVRKSVAPQEIAEIGEPTLRHTPNIRPMVWAALSDLKLKNLHVTFAADAKDNPVSEFSLDYDGFGNLPAFTTPVDKKHAALVDLSRLDHI